MDLLSTKNGRRPSHDKVCGWYLTVPHEITTKCNIISSLDSNVSARGAVPREVGNDGLGDLVIRNDSSCLTPSLAKTD